MRFKFNLKKITPKAFLVEEMRAQLKDAKIEVPEEEFKEGVDMIYQQFILPKLPKFIGKDGLTSFAGFVLISAACKKTIEAMKKNEKNHTTARP